MYYSLFICLLLLLQAFSGTSVNGSDLRSVKGPGSCHDNRDNRQYVVWHPFVTQTVLTDLAGEMSMNKDYHTIKERNK